MTGYSLYLNAHSGKKENEDTWSSLNIWFWRCGFETKPILHEKKVMVSALFGWVLFHYNSHINHVYTKDSDNTIQLEKTLFNQPKLLVCYCYS